MCAKGSSLVCVKIILLASNLLFILIGLTSVGIASWVLFWPKSFLHINGPYILKITAYATLSIGGVILLLAIIGCSGTALENRCILVTFFTLLCGILMACLVIGTLTTVFRRDLLSVMVNRMSIGVQQDYGISEFWTELLDMLQTRLQCCAVENNQADLYLRSVWYSHQIHRLDIKDFYKSNQEIVPINNLGIVNVPSSCCLLESLEPLEYVNRTACQTGSLKPNSNPYLNSRGCAVAILGLLQQYFTPLVVMSVILVIIMMVGLILSLLLLRNFNEYNYSETHLQELA